MTTAPARPLATTTDSANPLGTRLLRHDWAFLSLVIAAQAVWVWSNTRDHWFLYDFWAMLGDDDLSLNELMQSHGGHWTAYHRLLANLLYDTGGLSFWPAAGAVGGITWGLFALWSAWVTTKLGGSRWAAIAVGVLVGMGIGVVYKPWLVGKLIGHFSWVTASLIISGSQTTKRRALLFGVLVLGVSSGFQTVCFLGAAIIYCSLRRSLRFWLPSCFGALVIYLVWRSIYVTTSLGTDPDWSVRTLLSVPFHMFDVVASAIQRYSGTPFSVAVIITALIGAQLVYRQLAGVATHHESLATLTILAFTAVIVYSRVLTGVAPAAAPRYTMPIVLFILLGFAPSLLRLPAMRKPGGVAFLVLGAALVFGLLLVQKDTRERGFAFEEGRSVPTEDTISAAALLLSEGIPFEPTTRLRAGALGTGTLTMGQLSGLVEDGLELMPTADNLSEIQAALTIINARTAAADGSLVCNALDKRSLITGDQITVVGTPGRSVVISWSDVPGGAGSHQYELDVAGQLDLRILVAEGASYWIDPQGGAFQWCQ